MKYTIENINMSNKFVFFWGHQPDPNGIITKSCFSQWWKSSFMVNETEYKTTEHWMMAKKAELFDPEMLTKILGAKTPGEAKKMGRLVKNYNDDVWLQHRYEIVKEGSIHKFEQNENLKNFLLQTNERILVEASPVDSIWGIGLPPDSAKIHEPENWRGLNLLGFALMEARDYLKNKN